MPAGVCTDNVILLLLTVSGMRTVHFDAHRRHHMLQHIPAVLQQLQQLRHLTRLEFTFLPVTDAIVRQYIAKLTDLQCLELECQRGPITTKGLLSLVPGLSRLTQLNLLGFSDGGDQYNFNMENVSLNRHRRDSNAPTNSKDSCA